MTSILSIVRQALPAFAEGRGKARWKVSYLEGFFDRSGVLRRPARISSARSSACASRKPASFSTLASKSMARCARAFFTSGVALMKNRSLMLSVRSFFAIWPRLNNGGKVHYSLDVLEYMSTIRASRFHPALLPGGFASGQVVPASREGALNREGNRNRAPAGAFL